MRRTAALIAGGGPAGSAVAITLARAGVRAELVERNAGERDVVCGGFLGWDALAALGRLGVDPFSLGARPIERLRLVSGDMSVEAALPARAAGLSRRRLDAALLGRAGELGTRLKLGRTVRAIEPRGKRVRLDDEEEIAADALFLATGKHELRGAARDFGGIEPAVGLRAAIAPSGDLEGFIELHLFDEGYAGLLLQEDGCANLCLSVSKRRLVDAGGIEPLIELLCREQPRLHERLVDRPGQWETVAGVPYGWRASSTAPDIFRVGDQAAVIASLAGDGIAIALASGTAAAQAFLARVPAAAYQRDFSKKAAGPIGVAGMLRKAAESPRLRPPLMMLVRRLPGAASLAARLTRIG